MRQRIAGSVLAALLLLTCGGCGISARQKELIGVQAPYTKFQMLDGSFRLLEEYRGKKLVIVFWATHCNAAWPKLRRLEEFAESLGRTDVVFLAVSLDKPEDLALLKERISAVGIRAFDHSFSGNEGYDQAYTAFRGEELPYIIVVDRDGTVLGIDTDDDFVYPLIAGASTQGY